MSLVDIYNDMMIQSEKVRVETVAIFNIQEICKCVVIYFSCMQRVETLDFKKMLAEIHMRRIV